MSPISARNGKKSPARKPSLLLSLRRWLVRSTLVVMTLVLCGALVLSGYSEVVNPNDWIIPSFVGISFGVMLALCVAWSLVLIATRAWSNLAIFALALLLVSPMALRYFPLHFGTADPLTVTDDGREIEHIQRIRLLSYNTCFLGQARLGDASKPVPVLQALLHSDRDVVCMQEFCFVSDKKGHTLEAIRHTFKDKYPHSDFTPYSYNKRLGTAIFSKFPIVKVDRIDHRKKDYISAMYYQLQVGGRRVGLVNVHLQSNKFSQRDRKLYDDMIGHFATDSLSRFRAGLGHSLAKAWRLRAQEADLIADYVRANHPDSIPLIICGDMNDTPVSYCLHTLRGLGLSDTWGEVGFGPGITYHEHRFWFRIDHILHSPGLRSLEMHVRKDIDYSDHYPVEATFQLLPE